MVDNDGFVELIIAGKEVFVDEHNNRMYVCNLDGSKWQLSAIR
jgi:hypothetical protein